MRNVSDISTEADFAQRSSIQLVVVAESSSKSQKRAMGHELFLAADNWRVFAWFDTEQHKLEKIATCENVHNSAAPDR